MTHCVNAFKEWTGKASATIVYDSTVDEFTFDGLFDKVKGKANIAIIGFTTDGDVFGCFFSVAVTEQYGSFNGRDMFIFSFESHGRCKTPERFPVQEGLEEDLSVCFWKDDRSNFFWFGVAFDDVCSGFQLGNEKSKSYCCDMSQAFEGLEDTTLTGKNNGGTEDNEVYLHCTRLVAIQLS